MRFNKTLGMLAVLAGFNTVAQAEEQVAAEKKAPTMETLVKPTSANLQYRQYFNTINQGDDVSRVTSLNQARANLGFGLLNDKINSTVILAANRNANEAKVSQRRPQIISTMSVASKGANALDAYLDLYLPQAGKGGTEGHIGLEHTINSTLTEGSLGKLDLAVTADYDAIFNSRKEDGVYTNPEAAKSIGLTEVEGKEGQFKGEKSDPSLEADVEALVKYTPKALSALTVGAGIEYDRMWDPTYTVNEDGTTSMTYAPSVLTFNRLAVSYKMNDTVSLKNETFHTFNGLYASRLNGQAGPFGRVFNYTTLSYTMF